MSVLSFLRAIGRMAVPDYTGGGGAKEPNNDEGEAAGTWGDDWGG
jgi:hypothetical protein